MIIKLTNANESFKDKLLLINVDKIVSVFESENDKKELITFVYVDRENTWQVKETLEEIYGMLS